VTASSCERASGYRFGVAVGDDPEALVSAVIARSTAEPITRVEIEPSLGRFVLLWVTSVVDAVMATVPRSPSSRWWGGERITGA